MKKADLTKPLKAALVCVFMSQKLLFESCALYVPFQSPFVIVLIYNLQTAQINQLYSTCPALDSRVSHELVNLVEHLAA